jgi:hypothetical protein
MSTKPPGRNGLVATTDRNHHGQFVMGHNGGPGRPRGSRNRLSELFIADLQSDWERHGAAVIESVRRDDPVAYLRTVAVERNPYRDLSDEELLADLRASFSDLFPELQIVRRPLLIEKSKNC